MHEQPYPLKNLWTHQAFCKMPPHLACSELGAALPPATHSRPRRSSYEIDGCRIQFRNLYPNESSASFPAHPTKTPFAKRESGLPDLTCAAAQTGSPRGRHIHHQVTFIRHTYHDRTPYALWVVGPLEFNPNAVHTNSAWDEASARAASRLCLSARGPSSFVAHSVRGAKCFSS